MAEINLSKYGITGEVEILHNPSYEILFEEENVKLHNKLVICEHCGRIIIDFSIIEE